jgi:pseudaminic acid cytidylyltransferase
MRLAVIPARGGSKRIPRKNIRPFCGKPMIAWSIEVALKSGCFDEVIVSTDDAEIADVGRQWGAGVPFMRPVDLADDMTPTVPVVAHAVTYCLDLGWNVEHACCIYPCAPLLHIDDLREAFELFKTLDVEYVYPVTEYPHPVQRAMQRMSDGAMRFVSPERELTRTQDLEKLFHDAGQFYFGKVSAWLGHKKMHTAGIGMPIPSWRVVDIDTKDDWKRAELISMALRSVCQTLK